MTAPRSVGDDLDIVGAHYALAHDERMEVRTLALLDPGFYVPWMRAKATMILAQYANPADCPRLLR